MSYSAGGLDLSDASLPLRIAYDTTGSTDVEFGVSSDGDLTITLESGAAFVRIADGDLRLDVDHRMVQHGTYPPTNDNIANVFRPNFTSDGSWITAFLHWLGGTLTGANGDTTLGVCFIDGNIETQGNSEALDDADTLTLLRPDVTLNGGDTLATSSVLRISSVGTAGTDNWAINVEDGPSKFDDDVVIGDGSTGTSRTDQFLYVPTSAGVPTGTPTGYTGRVALCFDTTNNDLYVYDGSWIKVALS